MKNMKRISALVLSAALLLVAAGCSAQQDASSASPSSQPEVSSPSAPASSSSSAAASSTAPDSPDAVTSASVNFYQNSSLDKPQLMEAIAGAEGGCTIATVNADGTPNLIVAVPAAAGDSHLAFTWQENDTKANLQRGSQVVISYFLYNKDEPDKEQRYRGARVKGHLETDQAVIDKLLADDPTLPPICTFVVIDEVVPLG